MTREKAPYHALSKKKLALALLIENCIYGLQFAERTGSKPQKLKMVRYLIEVSSELPREALPIDYDRRVAELAAPRGKGRSKASDKDQMIFIHAFSLRNQAVNEGRRLKRKDLLAMLADTFALSEKAVESALARAREAQERNAPRLFAIRACDRDDFDRFHKWLQSLTKST